MLTRKQRAQLDKVTTMIGEDVILKDGVLCAQNTVRIDGQYKGEINSKGALIIGGSGVVDGNIQCENIVISGKVNGNIQSSNQVHIRDTGVVEGDISCLTIIIDEGAVFIGKCSITRETEYALHEDVESSVAN